MNCLKTLHLALGDAFSNILDFEFENDIHILKDTFMEAMQTHNLRKAPTAGVPIGPTSEKALESHHTLFDILYGLPRLSITFTECCLTS